MNWRLKVRQAVAVSQPASPLKSPKVFNNQGRYSKLNRQSEQDEAPGVTDDDKLVIHGITTQGKKLRPSDWIERISSTLASFGKDHRLQYHLAVKPCMIEGERCLVVARDLEQKNPQAYAFVMGFARSNQLCVQGDRRYDERALRVEIKKEA